MKATLQADGTVCRTGPSCRRHGHKHGVLKTVADVFKRFDSNSKSILLTSSTNHVDFEKEARDLFKQMSPAAKGAIYQYSDRSGSIRVNRLLAHPNYTLTGDDKQFVEDLDSAISYANPEVTRSLYRGAGKEHDWSNVSEGQTVEYKGYCSTSADAYTALGFTEKTSPVILQLETKGGLAVSTHADEYEYLLARGKKFTVTEVKRNARLVLSRAKYRADSEEKTITRDGITLITLKEIL